MLTIFLSLDVIVDVGRDLFPIHVVGLPAASSSQQAIKAFDNGIVVSTASGDFNRRIVAEVEHFEGGDASGRVQRESTWRPLQSRWNMSFNGVVTGALSGSVSMISAM